MGLVLHLYLREVSLMGNEWSAVVMCILYYFPSKNKVMAMGDLV